MGANQRHEPHRAQILALDGAVGSPRDLDQILDRSRIAKRHHQPPARLQLREQLMRHMASAGSGQDRIERRFLGKAERSVALDDPDIVVAELFHPLRGERDQLMLPLDRNDTLGDLADDRRGIARPGADLEHHVVGPISAASIIKATIYGCEIVCPASIGSGKSS